MMRASVDSQPPRTRFFGQFLLSHGLITASQLLAAVEYQNKYNSRLGELAVALGMVTHYDAEQINTLQQQEDLLFGEAAMRLGLLTRAQLDQVLATQKDAHVRLGQALEALGFLEPATLSKALSDFMDEETDRANTLPRVPAQFRNKGLFQALSEFTPKMLLRTWHLPTKPDVFRIEHRELVLSDINAMAKVVTGSEENLLVLGVPYAAAHRVFQQQPSQGTTEPQHQAMVCDFLDVLSSHIASATSERGQRPQIEPAQAATSRLLVADNQTALILPHLSQLGRVVVGLLA